MGCQHCWKAGQSVPSCRSSPPSPCPAWLCYGSCQLLFQGKFPTESEWPFTESCPSCSNELGLPFPPLWLPSPFAALTAVRLFLSQQWGEKKEKKKRHLQQYLRAYFSKTKLLPTWLAMCRKQNTSPNASLTGGISIQTPTHR